MAWLCRVAAPFSSLVLGVNCSLAFSFSISPISGAVDKASWTSHTALSIHTFILQQLCVVSRTKSVCRVFNVLLGYSCIFAIATVLSPCNSCLRRGGPKAINKIFRLSVGYCCCYRHSIVLTQQLPVPLMTKSSNGFFDFVLGTTLCTGTVLS